MAFNPAPTTLLPNWSEDGTNIAIPIASFPELTAAEADALTGDVRKVVFALTKKLADAYVALAAADKPTQMVIGRNAYANAEGSEMTHVMTFTFVNTIATQDVKDEPA
jgi:hypothetical protein